MTYLLLYIPVCMMILVVLEACRSDDPRRILKRSLWNFGVLTLALAACSAVVYFINRYL